MKKFLWPDPPTPLAFPIAKPGFLIIGAAAFTTLIFALLGVTVLALACLAFTLFTCFFFRDPDRVVIDDSTAIVSPADGKILFAEPVDQTDFFDEKCLKISIFMSIFNVHVNRIPYTGKVTKIAYHPGKFVSANLDKASKENEHNAVFLETATGQKICTVQIAGLIARRIICNIGEGADMRKGQRFGMICFGSRLDVYLPESARPNVSVGDTVQAGTSIIGYLD